MSGLEAVQVPRFKFRGASPRSKVQGPKLGGSLPFFDFLEGRFRWLERRKSLRQKRFEACPGHFPLGSWEAREAVGEGRPAVGASGTVWRPATTRDWGMMDGRARWPGNGATAEGEKSAERRIE